MPDRTHSQVVQGQFGPRAQAYLDSAVHAQGAEFAQLQAALSSRLDARVLDLGCGAGHVSFQVAPLAGEVVAYDLSAQMLALVAATAEERGLTNIRIERGPAERLPFEDQSFDFVFSRYSAHHWRDLGQALREVRRVLAPSGRACFIDVASPGQPLLDTHLQALEVLRDASHVRDYSLAQWSRQLSDAGLTATACQRQRLRLEFDAWVNRMDTPKVMRQAIRRLQGAAPQEVRDYFEIDAQGSFSTDVLVLWVAQDSGQRADDRSRNK